MRAFLAGKLDLTRAEAVQAVIEADDADELKQALTQLAGGLARPLEGLREDLLGLLADVEAALDFSEEDIQFVGREDAAPPADARHGPAHHRGAQQLERDPSPTSRSAWCWPVGQTPARAACSTPSAAPPWSARNRGRRATTSSSGSTSAARRSSWWTRPVGAGADAIEEQAQNLGREQAGQADLVLLCLPADEPVRPEDGEWLRQEKPPIVGVTTKCDLAKPSEGLLSVSAVSGEGLAALREALAERSRSRRRPALAPRLSRCRGHIEACLACLRRAHAVVLFEEPAELLALELRGRWNSWAKWSGRSIPMTCWIAYSADFASGSEARVEV